MAIVHTKKGCKNVLLDTNSIFLLIHATIISVQIGQVWKQQQLSMNCDDSSPTKGRKSEKGRQMTIAAASLYTSFLMDTDQPFFLENSLLSCLAGLHLSLSSSFVMLFYTWFFRLSLVRPAPFFPFPIKFHLGKERKNYIVSSKPLLLIYYII